MNKYYITYFYRTTNKGAFSQGVTGFIKEYNYNLEDPNIEDTLEILQRDCKIDIEN